MSVSKNSFIISIYILVLGLLSIVIMLFTFNMINNKYKQNYVRHESQKVESELDNLIININNLIESSFRELQMLGELTQFYIDHSQEFASITSELKSNNYFKDKLTFNGRWYQNSADEPSIVNVTRFLLDKNNNINEEAQEVLDNTLILDWLMPVFYKYGAQKNLIFFKGGDRKSISRLTPWYNLGARMDEIYPAFTDTPIWDTFFTGLIDDWKEWMNNPALINSKYSQAIASPPTQDGVTGQFVITFRYPIWSKDRKVFFGNVAFDVLIEDWINLIESSQIGNEGFAFLFQETGNLLAVNSKGANVLGFGEDSDYLKVTGKGIGFNRLERMFSNSDYEDIKNFIMPEKNKVMQNNVKLDSYDYIIISKSFPVFISWKKSLGFKQDNWGVGITIEEEKFYKDFNKSNQFNERQLYKYILIVSLVTIFLSILSFVQTKKRG